MKKWTIMFSLGAALAPIATAVAFEPKQTQKVKPAALSKKVIEKKQTTSLLSPDRWATMYLDNQNTPTIERDDYAPNDWDFYLFLIANQGQVDKLVVNPSSNGKTTNNDIIEFLIKDEIDSAYEDQDAFDVAIKNYKNNKLDQFNVDVSDLEINRKSLIENKIPNFKMGFTFDATYDTIKNSQYNTDLFSSLKKALVAKMEIIDQDVRSRLVSFKNGEITIGNEKYDMHSEYAYDFKITNIDFGAIRFSTNYERGYHGSIEIKLTDFSFENIKVTYETSFEKIFLT